MLGIFKVLIKQNKFQIKSDGRSMLPLLHSNDVLLYERVSFFGVKVNDIILISKNKRYFTHRVIYKSVKYLITKGDNNLVSDGRIYPNQIIAKVYQVKRGEVIFSPEDLYLLQSTLYIREIIKVKKTFEKEKIDFVFLKGLPLHLYYEKSHPRRIYADCDILIDKQDVKKAKKVLQSMGYRETDNSFSKTLEKFRNKETEISFMKLINGFPVIFDVHLEVNMGIVHLGTLNELYPQNKIDKLSQKLIEEKRMVKIQGENFPILSPENLIIYLSIHYFQHSLRGVYRLEFINKVIGKEMGRSKTVFTETAKTINDYRLNNFIYPVFILLKKYYYAHFPNSFLKMIQPADVLTRRRVNQIIKINIFDEESRFTRGITRFKNLFSFSPNPRYVKIRIFLNPRVIYSVFWVIGQKLKKLFSFSKTP